MGTAYAFPLRTIISIMYIMPIAIDPSETYSALLLLSVMKVIIDAMTMTNGLQDKFLSQAAKIRQMILA